ncbi:hypothetical protein F4859DRAFT_477444 [Xylaria cf. heliscus]|nr:hypothetical protein F4859DRAFT_477444 [Xylaria cf. heliscus]
MRLLDVQTLQPKSFLNEETRPPYAILSHTWREGEEVTFEDLLRYHEAIAHEQPYIADSIASRTGFMKIRGCCNIAAQCYGLKWACIDACCIDKRSSAELSGAINSMFKWYRDAEICYAFLEDVTGSENDPSFRNSRWFTRGWTLQELIAPKRLWFYDQEWQLLGKMEKNLEVDENSQLYDVVSSITSIPVAFLKGAPLTKACVAKRMSWASKRQTTRPEDVAYSLLGIFGVNIPLLYGEGPKAFIRLQVEIINQIHDHSILAWGTFNPGDVRSDTELLGVLATSPADFEDCGDFETAMDFFHVGNNLDFQVTPAGIKIGVNLVHCTDFSFCELSCFTWRYPSRRVCVILEPGPLAQTASPWELASQYVRRGRNLSHAWGLLFVGDIGLELDFQFHGNYTITIAKDTTSSIPREPRHVLLTLPDNHTFNIEYVHPDFKVEINTHQLSQNSLRISYLPKRPPFILTFLFGTQLLIPATFTLAPSCFYPGGSLTNYYLIFALTYLFIFYPTYRPIVVEAIIAMFQRIWTFMLGKGAGPRVNRRAIRARIRLTERTPRPASGEARQIMIFFCYQPSVVVNNGWTHVWGPRTACHLAPVVTGQFDEEATRPARLDGQWPRVYKRLEVRGKRYVQDTQLYKAPLRFEGPNCPDALFTVKTIN